MKILLTSLIVIIIIAVGYAALHHPQASAPIVATSTDSNIPSTPTPPAGPDETLHHQVTYFCAEGTFDALFTNTQVTLSVDGHTHVLPQAVSGSGIRYEGGGLTLIGKGNNATLAENGKNTYTNCIAGNTSASGAGTGLRAFQDASGTFTFTYPTAFTLSGGEMGYTQSWRTNATTSGLVLAVVTAPRSYEPGTNFSEAKFTVGVSSDPSSIAACTLATNGEVAAGTTTINGIKFAKVTFGGAGAGNFYDTTSYRALYDGDCYAVEYTIHSTNIGNYDPSQGIKEFDKAKIQNALEGIVKSFTFIVSPE